jgi:hypothetical protein
VGRGRRPPAVAEAAETRGLALPVLEGVAAASVAATAMAQAQQAQQVAAACLSAVTAATLATSAPGGAGDEQLAELAMSYMQMWRCYETLSQQGRGAQAHVRPRKAARQGRDVRLIVSARVRV